MLNTTLILAKFREANIDLLIIGLEQIVPLFFALACWVSVFIQDLKLLPTKMLSLYKQFKDGHFVVNTRGNAFSKIAMDQAQEHNNKKIKSSGSGYIDLVNTEDKRFLQKIELCWPEMYIYFVDVEGPPEAQGHKETATLFISTFNEDGSKVYNKLLTNPFSNAEFTKLNSAYIFPEVVVKDSGKVFTIGSEQYSEFCLTRFTFGSHDIITSKITKNVLKLPKDSDTVQVENPRITVNDRLLNKLCDACEVRPQLAKKVFQGEWTGLTECFVKKDCTPYHNTKSVILDRIANSDLQFHPKVEALVVDLSVVTRAQASFITPGSTFNDLSESIIKNITGTANLHEAN